MNIGIYLWAVVGVFLIEVIMEFVIHGIILSSLYHQTALLWRPLHEMSSLSWLIYLAYALFAAVFVYLYSKGIEPNKPGWAQGIRFGLWIGLLLSAPMALNCYAVMPIPLPLAIGWFEGGMAEMIVAGALVGVIFSCKQ